MNLITFVLNAFVFEKPCKGWTLANLTVFIFLRSEGFIAFYAVRLRPKHLREDAVFTIPARLAIFRAPEVVDVESSGDGKYEYASN